MRCSLDKFLDEMP